MKAEIKWLDDPRIFAVGRVDAHSDHLFFKDGREAERGQSSYQQCLNGQWKFRYSRNAGKRPQEFYQEDFDSSDFDTIAVPGHIELAGYDRIHYINTMYPWEGHLYRRPAYTLGADEKAGMFSEAEYNPVGSYLCRFDLEEELRQKRVRIRFEGVEQAMYLWLNGSFVGYAEDSFTPSEFDLTPYIRDTGNVLAVEVHKRSTAAFLEDQDFFRFFGIFRSVNLYALPEVHAEDIWVQPQYCPKTGKGTLKADLRLTAERIFDDEKIVICLKENRHVLVQETLSAAENLTWETVLERVRPWANGDPYLYTLEITVFDNVGKILEVISQPFGFWNLAMENKVMKFNGKRLVINGVNRHEWNPNSGRCITEADEKADMECFLRNNINAVRTCHYPDRLSWYDLCDRNGIYMMAEMNLESHGSWQKMGAIEPSWNVPGDCGEWKNVIFDRAQNNFEWLKNHVSILFWSLGNESFAGTVLAEMNRYYKEKDPHRMVHYEGVFHKPDQKHEISDMESRMYARPEEITEYLEKDPQKPFILCEFMHDMGNSCGGFGSYMKLLDKYEMYQGGFIWDFIDQALYVTDEVTGEKVLRYGGDFDDRPSDYEFSGNGVVFADRTEKPAMQEVRYYYGKYR